MSLSGKIAMTGLSAYTKVFQSQRVTIDDVGKELAKSKKISIGTSLMCMVVAISIAG